MIKIKVYIDDGNYLITKINTSLADSEGFRYNIQKCIKVEVIEEENQIYIKKEV